MTDKKRLMSRRSFLGWGLIPPAAAVASAAAKRLDPEGEPIEEGAPLIVVNAPNTVLQNLNLTSHTPRRVALELTKKGVPGSRVVGNNIRMEP